MKKKGFTLIELIAVIAILAVLAVVAVPRVIKYVDRSKKVAIQTEAITIYNAAEAAYNDGKFRVRTNGGASAVSQYFETIDVHGVTKFLEKEDVLSNGKVDKFEKFPDMTLKDLKAIMNMNVDDLNVSSDGKLLGKFTTSLDGKVTYDATDATGN